MRPAFSDISNCKRFGFAIPAGLNASGRQIVFCVDQFIYRTCGRFVLGHLLLEVYAVGVDAEPIDEPGESPVAELAACPVLAADGTAPGPGRRSRAAPRRCWTGPRCCVRPGGVRAAATKKIQIHCLWRKGPGIPSAVESLPTLLIFRTPVCQSESS
jgi:hypothetical protein